MSQGRPIRTARARDGTGAAESWAPASFKALALLVLSVLVFVYAPDRLATSLSDQVQARLRDILVVAWDAVWFLGLCWLAVRFQRHRRA